MWRFLTTGGALEQLQWLLWFSGSSVDRQVAAVTCKETWHLTNKVEKGASEQGLVNMDANATGFKIISKSSLGIFHEEEKKPTCLNYCRI